jgi:hypothetical protein
MAKRARKTVETGGQLEPLLRAFALRRLQLDAGGPAKPSKAAKSRSGKRKKA